MMENPFKQIIDTKEVPNSLKESVMNNINLINLSIELSDLHLENMPDSLCSILTEIKEEEELHLLEEPLVDE